MKAIMRTEDLRAAIKKVNVVGRVRTTLPVLAYTLVNFSKDKARMTATNLEQAVKVEFPSTCDNSFSVLLHRRTTERFLHGANGEVVISKDDNFTTIERPGIGKFRFENVRVEDFPPIPAAVKPEWHPLDTEWFCRMLNILIPACATEESRPVLCGIACRNGDMAAADGFRLVACKSDKLAFGLGEGQQVIIPAATAAMVRQLFSKDDSIEVAFDPLKKGPDDADTQRVHVRASGTEFISQVIQGHYPDWEHLIPADFNCKVSFSVPPMLQRLRMMDALQVPSGITRLVFQINEAGEHECLISAGSEETTGRYTMAMPIKIETQEVGRIAFSARYIEDAIRFFAVCTLEITSISSPGKFTGDIEGITIIVMPMFVQW
jgi:DNA polymerase III sliding clamp (beta) subunit (PCNA family)